jgi:hypothetical protein
MVVLQLSVLGVVRKDGSLLLVQTFREKERGLHQPPKKHNKKNDAVSARQRWHEILCFRVWYYCCYFGIWCGGMVGTVPSCRKKPIYYSYQRRKS